MPDPYVIGFTGTRRGMTQAQQDEVRDQMLTIDILCAGRAIGLHGDCVGADADFHVICADLDIDCLIRPCAFDNMRAHCDGEIIAEPTNPMARNREIAKQCDVLIGCPPNDTELKRGSGTWATIRYGVKYGKIVHIVYPDGRIETRDGRER